MLRHLSLSSRLTLALSTSALMLLGGAGVWQVRAEEADLRSSVERELRLLGRSLQVAFENALRDRQPEDVEETLRELERIDPSVDIFVYDRRGTLLAASTDAARRDTSERDGSALRFLEEGEDPAVEFQLPLHIAQDQRPAALVLVQPLTGMIADLDATRQRVFLSTAALVLVVFLVALAVSRLWVSAPLARMVAHMRRVRAGDLSTSGDARTRYQDEIGATLDEFDALVEDLAEARTRLEAQEERRRELELALREVDKLATVGQLAAGLAHEIGSPLQILDGRVAALASKAEDPGETRRLAGILREQTQRITRIVSRLTDLARRPATPARLLDATPPVRTVVELLMGEARRRGVALSLDVDHETPAVCADPDSIQQIALNLIRNALDATDRGGSVRVALGPSERLAPCDTLRLTVSDSGRGMDDEERRRAFEPFFTSRAPYGTGLGLAVVKGIVDDHRGRVVVDSALGRGTTLTVFLPAHDSLRGPAREEPRAIA